MSDIIQLIPILLCLLLFIGAIIAEVQWLQRKGWTTSGKAIGYVLTTDLLGFGIGSFFVLVIFFIMFMMVMGSAGRGSDIPESAYIASSLVGIIFPPVILLLLKRLFLLIFKIRSGRPAWIYSLVSSLLIMFVVLIPPTLIYVLIAYSSTWK